MTNETKVKYLVESEEEKAKLEKLYNNFISQYDIKPHKTELIIRALGKLTTEKDFKDFNKKNQRYPQYR